MNSALASKQELQLNAAENPSTPTPSPGRRGILTEFAPKEITLLSTHHLLQHMPILHTLVLSSTASSHRLIRLREERASHSKPLPYRPPLLYFLPILPLHNTSSLVPPPAVLLIVLTIHPHPHADEPSLLLKPHPIIIPLLPTRHHLGPKAGVTVTGFLINSF